MEIKKCYLTKNDCYKKATKITPKGIVVHSTGANNPNLKRYLQPDDGLLGVNSNNNSWNKSGISKCVHGFIGKDKNGVVRCYQTLPFNIACWGVGNGNKGSYNYNPTAHIQFEICEDGLKNEKYFNEAFDLAAELCAYLCKEYNLGVDTIVSHHECHLKGYGSNHGDCDNWLKKFNKDMNWFRSIVSSKMNNTTSSKPIENEKEVNYLVKITADELNVRNEPTTNSKINTTVKKGDIYTIIAEVNGWGKLKSGAGYISLNYTSKVSNEVEYPTKTVTASSLRVRSGAGLFYKTIGYLKKGDKVKVYSTKGSWSKVAKDANKWCSSKYLK